jgi:hypothetical protein
LLADGVGWLGGGAGRLAAQELTQAAAAAAATASVSRDITVIFRVRVRP